MKKLFLPLLLLFFFSCEDNSFDPGNPNVGKFVQMLKAGEYKTGITDSLPEFRSYDVSSLLQHSNDFREIPKFPVNPVSSYNPQSFRLGECLLWTIEAIRKTPPTAEKLNFPSLAPALILEEAPEGTDGRLGITELQEVYSLYEAWWSQKGDKSFAELQAINPLEGSGYRWR